MFLVRLIYTSEAININEETIADILSTARGHNAKNGVSGILHFNSNYFLQCLEGGRAAVNNVYHKILNDPRHTKPLLLKYDTICERNFSDWSMAYVGEGKLNASTFYKYSKSSDFDPYLMNGDSAFRLLVDLSASPK